MTQVWGVSNVRSIQTQGSSCTQFAHKIPKMSAACICSYGLRQSSLQYFGGNLKSKWSGWKGRSDCPRLAAVERHRGLRGPVCGALSIGQDHFEEAVLKSDLPVLVDFWAEWCGPCKLVAPVVDWAAKNYAGRLKVYKIETDANPELVNKYKPYGLPTLIVFKDGEEVPGSRKEGAITTTKLQAHLDELLPTLATT